MGQASGNFYINVKEHPRHLFTLSEFSKINFKLSLYFIVSYYKLFTVIPDVNFHIQA